MSGPTWLFDLSKRDAAIAQFALDKCNGGGLTKFGDSFYRVSANNLAALLREFFDAPTSQKLIAQKVGSATGLTADAPLSPLPPRDQP